MNVQNMAIKSKLLRITILCLAAEVLNFACVLLFRDLLHVPLFADTVCTVAITFLAGLIPGLVVAVLFNILRTLQLALVSGGDLYPWDMLYALCGLAIVFCTWAFAKKKENFQIRGIVPILYLVLIALLSAFSSSISCIIARIPMSVLDRLVCTFAGF